MLWNIASASSIAVYLYFYDELLVAAIALFASLNSVAQYVMPNSESRHFKVIRNVLAVSCAVIASFVLYEKPIDLVFCLGFFFVRIGEAQGSAIVMRFALACAMMCYGIFGLYQSLYLMAFMPFFVVIVFLAKTFIQQRQTGAV